MYLYNMGYGLYDIMVVVLIRGAYYINQNFFNGRRRGVSFNPPPPKKTTKLRHWNRY